MHNRLLINALSTVGQVVVSGLTYFFLYGIWVRELGVKQLGIWSIVWTTTYFAAMANGGIPVGVVKFVAEAYTKADTEKIRRILTISVGLTIILNSLICSLLYLNVNWIFKLLIDSSNDAQIAISIFPAALISFWLLNIANVFLLTLDGLQANYIRSILNIFSSLILFASAFILKNNGLNGITTSYIIYTSFLLISALISLIKLLKTPLILSLTFDSTLFWSLLKYFTKSQVGFTSVLFYDPITKFFLAKYGSLESVGLYEMANRLVSQVRTMIVSANQVMIPKIIETSVKSTENTKVLYIKMFKTLINISTPIFFSIIFFAPYISLIWIGRIELFFIASLYSLVFGWYFHTLSSPAYVNNMSTGELKQNINQHLLIATLNTTLSALGGVIFGEYGIVIAWAITLFISSCFLVLIYQKERKIKFFELYFDSLYYFFIFSTILIVGGSVESYFLHKNAHNTWISFLYISILSYIFLCIWLIRKAPIISNIFTNLLNLLPLKKRR